MRIVYSRRESFRTALAAMLAPPFAWLWPARAKPQHDVADPAPLPLTTTYRYDEQGRLTEQRTAKGGFATRIRGGVEYEATPRG